MGDAQVAVVIEDDDDIAELTRMLLSQSGYTVHRAGDGLTGLKAVLDHDPILTTLDVQMPGIDGFEVARRLRAFSQTYLIMVTSRAEEADVIAGFEAGADDYLTKPFRPLELLARAEAMLRRSRTSVAPASPAAREPHREPGAEPWVTTAVRGLRESPSGAAAPGSMVDRAITLGAPGTGPGPRVGAPVESVAAAHRSSSTTRDVHRFSDLELDAASGQVRLAGRRIQLDREESDLLSALMVTGRRVRSRADLALALQPSMTSYFVKEVEKTVVDQRMTGLRRKLGDDESRPRFIEPVRGVGYRMAG